MLASSKRALTTRVGVALALFAAAEARAADTEPERPVSVEYAAPAGCLGAQGFADQLRQRSSRVRVVDAGSAQRVRVRIEPREGAFVGRLVLGDARGAEAERVVEGRTCGEVVASLAFVTALALDAQAGSSDAESSAAAADGATAPRTSAEPADALPPPPPLRDEPRADEAPTRSPPPREWSVALGVDARVQSGPTPSVALSAPVFVDLAQATPSVLALRLRARFERTGGSTSESGAGANFTWTVGTVELCPLEWSSHAAARLGLCGRAEAGVLAAEGTAITPARSASRPWASGGGLARAAVVVLDPFFFELEGSLGAVLVRDRFFVEPDSTVFQPAPLAWGVALGAGARIW